MFPSCSNPHSSPNELIGAEQSDHSVTGESEVEVMGDSVHGTSEFPLKEFHLGQRQLEIDSSIYTHAIKASSAAITDQDELAVSYKETQNCDVEVRKLDDTAEISSRSGLKAASFTAIGAIPSISVTGSKAPEGQRAIFRRKSRIQFAALCLCLFLEGWNSGSTGPLLPVIQEYYHVGFALVSLIFVIHCLGFIVGAILNVWLNDRYGFGKVMILGSICPLISYIIQIPAPPFPVMVIASGISGFGMSVQDSQANGFVGSLNEHMATKLGFMHGSFGLGAFAAPLLATYFSGVRHWSFHYIVSAGIAVINTVVLCTVFRGKTQDELLLEAGQEPVPGELQTQSAEQGKYQQILSLKAVHFLALFTIIYIGVEVTVGGWIVTFIIRQRDGGRSSGYISSGFFGGLTLGRVGLMWFSERVGEHRVVFLYSILIIALEITVWLVPSIIENAVAVSFIGVLLGPMFPIVVSHSSKILPRRLLTGSVSWITGIGMSGSAALPFVTGILASRYGIGSLQPLLVTMMSIMVGVWALVPKSQRRVD